MNGFLQRLASRLVGAEQRSIRPRPVSRFESPSRTLYGPSDSSELEQVLGRPPPASDEEQTPRAARPRSTGATPSGWPERAAPMAADAEATLSELSLGLGSATRRQAERLQPSARDHTADGDEPVAARARAALAMPNAPSAPHPGPLADSLDSVEPTPTAVPTLVPERTVEASTSDSGSSSGAFTLSSQARSEPTRGTPAINAHSRPDATDLAALKSSAAEPRASIERPAVVARALDRGVVRDHSLLQSNATQANSGEESTLHVTIGRVEVRAPAPIATAARGSGPPPRASLDAYSRQRREGRFR